VAKPRKRQPQTNCTPIYRADGRAIVGRVEGDTFYKRARSTVHLLRRPRAWACDVDALDQARAAGAEWVEILDQDTGARYRAALADFYRRGLKVDRGHGLQLALPLAAWDVVGRATSSGRGALQDAAAGGPVQMRLIA
jgi:hypothetical protein